eukprot:m.51523 g.51523  ORF g.51523 m.51523 type:complete len:225 (-) comp6617_c0_seq1:367-1041(-)
MAEATTFEDETRFFGISPVNVVDLVINAVNEFAVDGAENVMSLLKEPERVESLSVDVDHLPENMNVALGFVQKAIDKYFDLFELYCFKNIFHIPETLPLPGDLPEVVPTAEEEEALDKELKQLREQIQAVRFRRLLCKSWDHATALMNFRRHAPCLGVTGKVYAGGHGTGIQTSLCSLRNARARVHPPQRGQADLQESWRTPRERQHQVLERATFGGCANSIKL